MIVFGKENDQQEARRVFACLTLRTRAVSTRGPPRSVVLYI